MDNLDRMYRHLVRTVRARFPQYLTQPFDVTTLQSTILPYRLHRRELGLESNDEYEITLTELLAGARDYLVVDEPMRDALKRALAATNADPAAYKQFLNATVALSPGALRSLEAGPDDPSTPLAGPAVTTRHSAAAAPAALAVETPPVAEPVVPSSVPIALRSGGKAITPQPGERCRACNEVLPPARPITFCPHCGQNLTTMHCPACGSELEVGWKFCPICGRTVVGTSE